MWPIGVFHHNSDFGVLWVWSSVEAFLGMSIPSHTSGAVVIPNFRIPTAVANRTYQLALGGGEGRVAFVWLFFSIFYCSTLKFVLLPVKTKCCAP